jgi:hypothetical protein
MNPEDEYQLELNLDDVDETLSDWDPTYSLSSSPVTVTLGPEFTSPKEFYKDAESIEIISLKEELNKRLQRIEQVLGIPKDLNRNKEIEEKHPHIKAMAEAYELEVEKHITLELLTPPEIEEDDLPF